MKEENLLRRAAIERILKRRLVSKLYGISIMPDVKAKEIAEPMALELMRSGYFDRGRIGRKQVEELENILNKYIKIMTDSRLPRSNDDIQVKKRINFYNWIIEVAACEIEELLFPNFKENALLNLMTNVLTIGSKLFLAIALVTWKNFYKLISRCTALFIILIIQYCF